MADYTVSEGGAYAAINEALSAMTEPGTISVEGTWSSDDTTSCTVDYDVVITADEDSANPGYVPGSPTHYRHREASGHAFTLNADFTITGIDVGSQSTGTSDEIFRCNAASISLIAKKCLLWFNSRNSEQDILYTNNNNNISAEFEDCGFWNVYRGVIDIFAGGAFTGIFKFNSCHGYDIGYSAAAGNRSGVVGASIGAAGGTLETYMFNCAWEINTGYVVSYTPTGTNNVTADRTLTNVATFAQNADTETLTDIGYSKTWVEGTPSPGEIGVNDFTGGAMDLRLVNSTNNLAQDNHADGSGATLTMPGTDIVGTSRPQNTNYDIGFFEVAAAGGAVSANDEFYKTLLSNGGL